MLVPPEGYSMVEIGLFRCLKLDAINISFLKCINLKSIVWIGEESPCRAVHQFIRDTNIKLHHLTSSGFTLAEEKANKSNQDWMVLRPSIIAKAIELILNTENHNCLVMDTSEVIIGVLRSIQKWNYYNILDEYRLYSRKSSYKAATFLEMIRIDLLPNEEDVTIEKEEEYETLEEAEASIVSDNECVSEGNMSMTNIPTQAIDILRSPSRETDNGDKLQYSWQATSPTFRRLSFSHESEKLGISTSPQIPSALLRRAKRPPKSGSKTPNPDSAPPEDLFGRVPVSPVDTITPASAPASASTEYLSLHTTTRASASSTASTSLLPSPLTITLPPQRTLPDWFLALQQL